MNICLYKNDTIVYYIAIFIRALDFLQVLAALVQSLSVHNGGKNVLPLAKPIHSLCENTLLVYYLFV